MKKLIARVLVLKILCFALLLPACATPTFVYHNFAFDMNQDGQHALILEYRYGTRDIVSVRNRLDRPTKFQSVTQPMYPGEFLYVKWQDTTDNAIHEREISLVGRLPENLERSTVTFLVSGPDIRVFVVGPAYGNHPLPPGAPALYMGREITQIYP